MCLSETMECSIPRQANGTESWNFFSEVGACRQRVCAGAKCDSFIYPVDSVHAGDSMELWLDVGGQQFLNVTSSESEKKSSYFAWESTFPHGDMKDDSDASNATHYFQHRFRTESLKAGSHRAYHNRNIGEFVLNSANEVGHRYKTEISKMSYNWLDQMLEDVEA
jgi:hypothetical protein